MDSLLRNLTIDEVWKKHPWLNLECSTTGRVRNHSTKTIIIQKLDNRNEDPYYRIEFTHSTQWVSRWVHRLILQTFKPKPRNGQKPYLWMCDHINRIRTDNRIENLRWSNETLNNLNKGQKNYWKDRNKYQVAVRVAGKRINFGRYKDEKDAKRVAKKALKETFESCECLYELLDKVVQATG